MHGSVPPVWGVFPLTLPQHGTRWPDASSVSCCGPCSVCFALAILWHEENLRAEQQHSGNCWGGNGCCPNNLQLTVCVLFLEMLSQYGNQHLFLQWQLMGDEGEAGRRCS